jgi:hypothetical protein
VGRSNYGFKITIKKSPRFILTRLKTPFLRGATDQVHTGSKRSEAYPTMSQVHLTWQAKPPSSRARHLAGVVAPNNDIPVVRMEQLSRHHGVAVDRRRRAVRDEEGQTVSNAVKRVEPPLLKSLNMTSLLALTTHNYQMEEKNQEEHSHHYKQKQPSYACSSPARSCPAQAACAPPPGYSAGTASLPKTQAGWRTARARRSSSCRR